MGRIVRLSLAVLMLAGLAGCQSSKMIKSEALDHAPVPAPGKAMVVFLRAASRGGAVQASVYDTGDSADQFIGIVSTKSKIAWQAEPGDHLFMVIGENADFMIAHLEAGKTYYALVSPRMGVWKARFSLLPIHNDSAAKYKLDSENFRDWMQRTSWVRNSAESEQWFKANEGSIREKKTEYMRKWNAAAPIQREELTLNTSDGV